MLPALCLQLMIYLVSPFGVQVQHSKLLLYHGYAESCIMPPACSSPEGQIFIAIKFVLHIRMHGICFKLYWFSNPRGAHSLGWSPSYI